ncbi:MAG: hypothetical protein K940chlam7_01776 [Chlamydiae bacterium]|nr:hypothetical protein [Chlamydiota bacterium]
MKQNAIKKQVARLEPFLSDLNHASSLEEKISILDAQSITLDFLEQSKTLLSYLKTADKHSEFVIKAVAAIGEGPIVFRGLDSIEEAPEPLENLVDALWSVEEFYDMIGGIVGYHCAVLKLIYEKEQKCSTEQFSERYAKPQGYGLSGHSPDLRHWVRWGVEHLPEMAEIYPVGGAGDRLNLRDENTNEYLPVAQLLFGGRTLLEGLIRDLQAREYLYYKLVGKQLTTPLLMMTSQEKNNHQNIQKICKEHDWFDRPRESFFFFVQPRVPVITLEGHWSMQSPLELTLKPGGHGVIWKLAKDHGAFQWLAAQNRKKALLRQINNPAGGTDGGLLAFCGIGCQEDKAFGFASCPKVLNAAEGMDILIEREVDGEFEYLVSNIEYTDFAQKGVEDAPETPGSQYSKYPANTNILFADLKTVENTLTECPIPGMIINFKNNVPFTDSEGKQCEVKGGRLESTMQNISDYIVDRSPHRLNEEALLQLRTFVTYNDRRKTISVTKRSYDSSLSLLETPEGCYYEILQNNRELLNVFCSMDLPQICSEEEYLNKGPNLILSFHPALGPLYSVIAQKIRDGNLAEGAELQLEIAEVDLENLQLSGSLLVTSDSPMGRRRSGGTLKYGEDCGKCTLRNVKIQNKGIDRSADNVYWKNQISHIEQLQIKLSGNAEFFAENITFNGKYIIDVPDGYSVTAYEKGGKVHFCKEKIQTPTWFWGYSFGPEDQIQLLKVYTS